MKPSPSTEHRWRVLLVLVVVTPLVTGYLILPIARALGIAHPPRSAVCCSTPADFGHAYEDITVPSAHGLKLRGWLVPSQNGAMVVVAHGFGGNRISTREPGRRWQTMALAFCGSTSWRMGKAKARC